jgi:diguanylate cyclase (GGDEF)-like protein
MMFRDSGKQNGFRLDKATCSWEAQLNQGVSILAKGTFDITPSPAFLSVSAQPPCAFGTPLEQDESILASSAFDYTRAPSSYLLAVGARPLSFWETGLNQDESILASSAFDYTRAPSSSLLAIGARPSSSWETGLNQDESILASSAFDYMRAPSSSFLAVGVPPPCSWKAPLNFDITTPPTFSLLTVGAKAPLSWDASGIQSLEVLAQPSPRTWSSFPSAEQDITCSTCTELERECTDLRDERTKWRLLALEDALTGIPNRRSFDVAFAAFLKRANRLQEPFTYMVLDLDHFKAVNDKFGHPAGDKILKEVARLVEHLAKRSEGRAFRIGGEELVVLLPTNLSKSPGRIAEDIRDAVQANVCRHADDAINCTISIGVASIHDGEDGAHLVNRADKALYESKSKGRNRVTISKRQDS